MLDILARRWVDLVPPGALLVLGPAIVWAVAVRRKDVPYRSSAVVLAVSTILYGLGAALQVLLVARPTGDALYPSGYWLPGAALAGLGPLAVPVGVNTILFASRRSWWLLLGLGVAAWSICWGPHLLSVAWEVRLSELTVAAYVTITIALAVVGLLWRGDRVCGFERRLLATALPFFACVLLYLALKPQGTRQPTYSTLLLVCGQLVLLRLAGQSGDRKERLSSGKLLVLQGLLLAMGTGLILVLAANLGVFPNAPRPLLTAAGVATALALIFGNQRARLNRLLLLLLYPESERAERRVERLREELESARERLRKAEHSSLVGHLAAQVAHEIKNPLGPIKGYAKIIEREVEQAGAMNPKIRRGIDVIREEVESIDARARALLEAARPPDPELRLVDMTDVVESAVDLIRSGCSERIALLWRKRPPPLSGLCDPLLLRSALTNVMQNAVQALEDRAQGRIEIELVEINSQWQLLVDDNGPGPPVQDPEELFHPFVSRRRGGYGLGLVIARGALRAQSGDLTLEALPVAGTRAVVTLPHVGEDGQEGTDIRVRRCGMD
ncbi:PAS domain-containing sensor histidine kinase [Planctomycetota bacterium]